MWGGTVPQPASTRLEHLLRAWVYHRRIIAVSMGQTSNMKRFGRS
ncbi:hypothetical protein L917_11296 [Phytophthora nicotianae]|uniref:Uncharacterized protein n=1 Tax=Phytophthora nicotianae TaxID=4792 RepID=W2KXB5_PHYNI|nr:hypothetical protein L917_11296 [Phytophthora nicotianae]